MGFYGSQWENVCYLWKIYKIIIINDNFFFYRNYQRVYKPGFVSKILIVVIHLESLLLNFSSDLPKKLCRNTKNVSSIWSCSKWGLPCHFYH